MHAAKVFGKPQKTYAATVKCKDWRIEELGDDEFRYYGALTIMASTLAYQDYSEVPSFVETVVKNCWKVKYMSAPASFLYITTTTTYVLIQVLKKIVVIII